MCGKLYCVFQPMLPIVQAEITDGVIDMLENETNPIIFSCQAIGEPVPNISWHFNGVLINILNSSKYIISKSSNGTGIISLLTIMNAQSSDVGKYGCFAVNTIGSDISFGILTVNGKNIYFHVVHNDMSCHACIADAAEILEPTRDAEGVKERENITLTCIGVGHPPPLVQWTKLNGSLSDQTSVNNMSVSTNEGNVTRVTVNLIVTTAYREDTGVYECLVSNLLNVVTRNVSLTVQCMWLIS